MTTFLTLEEERTVQREFAERCLRSAGTYLPLDYDADLNDNGPVAHPHKPVIEAPSRVSPIVWALLGASAFVILAGMAVLHK